MTKTRSVSVIYNPDKPDQVSIGTEDGQGDPWEDLALLLEGVGVLVRACINSGVTEHNGMPLKKYLNQYIDKVCDDYKRTMSVVPAKKKIQKNSIHDGITNACIFIASAFFMWLIVDYILPL